MQTGSLLLTWDNGREIGQEDRDRGEGSRNWILISDTNPTIHVKKKSPEFLISGTNPEWPRPFGIRTKLLVKP